MTIRTAPDAVATFKQWTTYPARLCLNAVSRLYQHGDATHVSVDQPVFTAGSATAHWNKTDAAHKRPGDRNAPAGALYQCTGGEGHIFLALGNERARSTDFPVKGQIGEGSLQEILDHFSGNPFAGYVTAINGREIQGLAFPPSAPSSQDIHAVALQVIRGDWDNGDVRKQRLQASGYDYSAVQAEVNAILSGSHPVSRTYTVQAGDSLTGIARRLGIADWHTLWNLNRAQIPNANVIHPGQRLVLP